MGSKLLKIIGMISTCLSIAVIVYVVTLFAILLPPRSSSETGTATNKSKTKSEYTDKRAVSPKISNGTNETPSQSEEYGSISMEESDRQDSKSASNIEHLPLTVDEYTFFYNSDFSSIYLVTTEGILKYGDKVIDTNVRTICPSHKLFYIKDDNTLWGYGTNEGGLLGDGTGVDKAEPIKILDDVAMVEKFGSIVYAITTDKKLWTWGGGVLSPQVVTNSVVSISRSYDIWGRKTYTNSGYVFWSQQETTINVLKSDGILYTYDPSGNPLGIFANSIDCPWLNAVTYSGSYWVDATGTLWRNENVDGEIHTEKIPGGDDVVKVFSIDLAHTDSYWVKNVLFIKKDNTLWGYGLNMNGELGDGTKASREDKAVKIANDVFYAYPYAYFNMSGEIWTWTENAPTPQKKYDNVANINIDMIKDDAENISVIYRDGRVSIFDNRPIVFSVMNKYISGNFDMPIPTPITENKFYVKIPRTLSFNSDGTYEILNPIG